MKNPPFFIPLFLSLFLSFSCAQTKNLSKQNKDFYLLAKRAKEEMPKPQYKAWLLKKIRHKKARLAGLEGREDREGQLLGNHEAMTESATAVGGPQDVHGFKADRSRQKLKEMENERLLIKRHLFYLNSQLSELDSKLKL